MTDPTGTVPPPHPTLSQPWGDPDYDPTCADCREGRHGRLAEEEVRGWIVEQGPLGNVHVIPAEQQGTIAEHEITVGCWCEPRRADPESPDIGGGDVYLHRRTHDHGHRYKDDER